MTAEKFPRDPAARCLAVFLRVLILLCSYCRLSCYSPGQRTLRGQSEASQEGAERTEQVEQIRRAQQDGVAGEHSQLSWQRLPGDRRLQQSSTASHDRLRFGDRTVR